MVDCTLINDKTSQLSRKLTARFAPFNLVLLFVTYVTYGVQVNENEHFIVVRRNARIQPGGKLISCYLSIASIVYNV